MTLLTLDRLHAAAQINRWRGWTKRPYSILEHQWIGARVMLTLVHANTEDVRAFMVHDMHETEIVGDVPTPDKKLYCTTMFDIACEDFDTHLGAELGMRELWWRNKLVKWMDKQMLLVENAKMSTRPDPTLPTMPVGPMWDNIGHYLVDASTDVVGDWLKMWKYLGGADVK